MAELTIRARARGRQRWWYAVLAVYAALLSLGIWRHEPWFDEAQAWLFARDARLLPLLAKWLRYEGSPGLWHVLLAVPAKLGLPYRSLNLLAGLIATAGIAVFLRYSQFPTAAKILLPFTYFLAYQYAVVARSYVLMPLLLFLIASLYRDKMRRTWLYCLLLCLLANTNLHGLLIALSLMALHVLDWWPRHRQFERGERNRQYGVVLVFSAVVALLVLQLRPPADVAFANGHHLSPLRFLEMTLGVLSDALEGAPLLSLPVLVVSGVWFHRHGVLRVFLLPALLLCLLFSVKVFHLWHGGIPFLLWIFTAWLAFDDEAARRLTRAGRTPVRERVFPWLLTLVLLVQIHWSASAFRFDLRHNYSASREAAQYLKDHDLSDRTIYISGFHCLAVLPYFRENLFQNLNEGHKPCYWLWSVTRNPQVDDPHWVFGEGPGPIAQILRDRPELVLVGIKFPYQRMWENLPGYEQVRSFEGNLCWKGGPCEADSFVLLRRQDPPANAGR